MNREVQSFKEAAARVIALLTGNENLSAAEEETIAAEVGRIRSELGLWRKRRGADGQRPSGVWQIGCAHCKFKRDGLTLAELRSARTEHERETGHKCSSQRLRPLRRGETP